MISGECRVRGIETIVDSSGCGCSLSRPGTDNDQLALGVRYVSSIGVLCTRKVCRRISIAGNARYT